ncbi:MAG: multicopper oxidase family protein [Aquiluna sp.]|jgi:FtsP/CotA-like multicopper oxidase with cupredoxin domain
MKVSRRALLGAGTAGLATVALASCTKSDLSPSQSAKLQDAIDQVESGRFSSGIARRYDLIANTATVSALGASITTSVFGDQIVGPEIRAGFGDQVSVITDNRLAKPTSVHFHGLALKNNADGVPMLTQDHIPTGNQFEQSFKAPHPGTYWYHSHTGLQQDEGLMGPLVIEDPNEPLSYDEEWVVFIDDWSVGFGNTPEENLAWLKENSTGGHGGMGMMGGASSGAYGLGASDLQYPHFLINGRLPNNPELKIFKPGTKVRLRIINGGSDTAFAVYFENHDLEIVASDGFPVVPMAGSSVLLGMGERYDALVTIGEGGGNLVAMPIGKAGAPAVATVGTGISTPQFKGASLPSNPIEASQLQAADGYALEAEPTYKFDLSLQGSMSGYKWAINGASDYFSKALSVKQGDSFILRFTNNSMMFHPMHLHGHTFQVTASNGSYISNGPRKDTLIVKPMEIAEVLVHADNPGLWALHCHNSYHMEAGMMTSLQYEA